MKKMIMLSGLVLLAWGSYAQTSTENNSGSDSLRHTRMQQFRDHKDNDRQAWGHRRGERDGRKFHFSPDQRDQMMAINKSYHEKAAALFKNDNLTLRQYKTQLLALQKEKKSKLQALLTPEQKEQFAKRKKQAIENMQVMAAARLERLKIRLNLTDEQTASIKSTQASLRAQAQSIRGDENLLPEQKREEYKNLKDKRKEAIVAVLNSEQRAIFEEKKGDRWEK